MTINIEEPNENKKNDNESNQLYPEAIKTLEKRWKRELLNWLEKKEIIKLLDNKIMTKQQFWMNFNLSVSAVNKIITQYWLNKSTFSSARRLPWKLKKSAAVVKIIRQFVENRDYPYTSKYVQNEIDRVLDISVLLHIIRDILK